MFAGSTRIMTTFELIYSFTTFKIKLWQLAQITSCVELKSLFKFYVLVDLSRAVVKMRFIC